MKLKRVKVKRPFYVCPKCGNEKYSYFVILELESYIYECFLSSPVYLKDDDKTTYQTKFMSFTHTYRWKELKNAIDNINKYMKKAINFNEVKKVIFKEGLSHNVFGDTKPNFNQIDGLDIKLVSCYNCDSKIPFEAWNVIEKEIEAVICPKCKIKVEDVACNRTGIGVLACPNFRCGNKVGHHFSQYLLNHDLEIMNETKATYPLNDHLRYDKKTHLVTLHPYRCSGEELLELLVLAKKLNYKITILGRSEHNQNCFAIHMIKKDRRRSILKK